MHALYIAAAPQVRIIQGLNRHDLYIAASPQL